MTLFAPFYLPCFACPIINPPSTALYHTLPHPALALTLQLFPALHLFCTGVQEKKQLLSFLIVGGGPTGVEVAAELQDMVEADLVKVYPDLIKDVRIAVIELQDHVLSTYDRRISEYTRQIFTRYAFWLL